MARAVRPKGIEAGLLFVGLTDAEASAIECRPLDEEDYAPLARAIVRGKGRALVFPASDREALRDLVNESSNAEDEGAQQEADERLAGFARRASLALSRLLWRL